MIRQFEDAGHNTTLMIALPQFLQRHGESAANVMTQVARGILLRD